MTDSDNYSDDASNSDDDNSLKDWLASNKLSKILSVLNDNDIESLSDFAALETRKEIEEFADELQLKVIKRKKFIKAVLKLNSISKPKPNQAPEKKIEKESPIECDFNISDISEVVLKQWKLGQYAKNFNDAGFDDVNAWQELTMDELTNVLKMKYAHAKKFIKNRATLVQNSNSDFEEVNDAARLLKEWKLEKYVAIFQEEDYNDVNDWQEITMDELISVFSMKYAHAKKFIKNRATLVHSSSDHKNKNINKSEIKSNEEESSNIPSNEELSDAARFLKEWKLDGYIAIFEEQGYDDIEGWQDLTMNELKNDLEMKPGHARTFLRKRSKMKQNNVSDVLSHKHIDPTPGAYEGEENKYEGSECTPPPSQQRIETEDQRSKRKRKEANAHLRGNNNIVPILKYKNVQRPHKTILVLGATGTGKTTLLNSMMNYLYEVEFDDPYRFKLINEQAKIDGQATNQTDHVTTYILSPPILDYDLTVIDTPGFGDTRGLDQDNKIIQSIKKCFETTISEINAICFVIRAPQARLTATQRYMFSQVLGIFGADILRNNIFILLTFADHEKPPAIAALKAGNIPFVKYFKLNNSAFKMVKHENDEMDAVGSNFAQLFWLMGMTAFKTLFSELNKVETKSLTLTKQVLTSSIALRPNVMSQEDYIEEMIIAEEDEKKYGWKQRVGSLRNMMKNNQMMNKIQDANYNPFANYGDVSIYMMRKRGKNANTNAKKKGFKWPWQ